MPAEKLFKVQDGHQPSSVREERGHQPTPVEKGHQPKQAVNENPPAPPLASFQTVVISPEKNN